MSKLLKKAENLKLIKSGEADKYKLNRTDIYRLCEKEKLEHIATFLQSAKNENLHDEFKAFLDSNGLKFKDIGPAFRVALIGETSSIGIFEIIAVIGFEETKKRILCNF